MIIDHLDHLVLTVQDIDKTCEFYSHVLGMRVVTFGPDRKALQFKNQKINLHQKGKEFEPKALNPTPGSADLCFIADTAVEIILEELHHKNIPVVEGIVERTGATGKILSVYIRDPDMNLIEISNYQDHSSEQ
jgi:catechol 2,3-dioxygenase-like lactoylglutathione lyase family enzyme